MNLPDDLDERLRQVAQLRGVTGAEPCREAIAHYLPVQTERRFGAAGAGRSGRSDVSSRIKETPGPECTR